MSVFSQSQANAIKVGNDAGWMLEFYGVDFDGSPAATPAVTLKSSDYYASIEASLEDGLSGGTYTFTIDALTDADYKAIVQGDSGTRPIAAKLYLFWNDAISGPLSYLKNLAGLSSGASGDMSEALVAVLYVSKAKRKVGAMVYQTEIHATEWAYHAMRQPLQTPLDEDTYSRAAFEITTRTTVTINTYPEGADRLTTDPPGQTGKEDVHYGTGKTYADILTDISSSLEKNTDSYGRKMVLIRDGEIHLGPRKFPVTGDPTDLTVSTGLLEVSKDGSTDQDPTKPDVSGGTQRSHFTLTLKGRGDIKPGDLVRFDPSPEDEAAPPSGIGSALLGSLAGPLLPVSGMALSDNPLAMAVSSVKHRLGKDAGFWTEVRGVVLDDPSNPWDSYADKGASPKPQSRSPKSDAGSKAADSIKDFVDNWGSNRISIDVGQVRAFTGSDPSIPSQTETIWEGLQEQDANPNGTRRFPVDPRNSTRVDIPYATPFAWGKCGLVLPKYPGVRVALGHRRGLGQDPIDLGAIWDSGQGPATQPGDWWLILPVGIDPSKRDKAADSDAPTPWAGAVSQDLIDADGNRVIELGSLVVRVGKQDLRNAGERPDLPDDAGSITIENTAGNSKIVMKQDGSISIQGASITLDAGNGNVTINAKQVNVNVSDSMNVK